MRFVPHYTVSYHGKFYRAGMEFEINNEDADFMSEHGAVIGEKPSEEFQTSQAVNALIEPEKPQKRAVRPRKQR